MARQVTRVPGAELSALNQPRCGAVDSSDNIYTTEVYNYRVLFWPNGASSEVLIAGNGRTFSLTSLFSIVAKYWSMNFPVSNAGSSNNRLDQPHDTAHEWSTSIFYASDYNNHQVLKYLPEASSGSFVAGGDGSG